MLEYTGRENRKRELSSVIQHKKPLVVKKVMVGLIPDWALGEAYACVLPHTPQLLSPCLSENPRLRWKKVRQIRQLRNIFKSQRKKYSHAE